VIQGVETSFVRRLDPSARWALMSNLTIGFAQSAGGHFSLSRQVFYRHSGLVARPLGGIDRLIVAWSHAGQGPHVGSWPITHQERRSVYRRGQTSSKGNWLRTGKAEAAPSHIGFAGCASRASGAHWSVSVTHRFLRRGKILFTAFFFRRKPHSIGSRDRRSVFWLPLPPARQWRWLKTDQMSQH